MEPLSTLLEILKRKWAEPGVAKEAFREYERRRIQGKAPDLGTFLVQKGILLPGQARELGLELSGGKPLRWLRIGVTGLAAGALGTTLLALMMVTRPGRKPAPVHGRSAGGSPRSTIAAPRRLEARASPEAPEAVESHERAPGSATPEPSRVEVPRSKPEPAAPEPVGETSPRHEPKRDPPGAPIPPVPREDFPGVPRLKKISWAGWTPVPRPAASSRGDEIIRLQSGELIRCDWIRTTPAALWIRCDGEPVRQLSWSDLAGGERRRLLHNEGIRLPDDERIGGLRIVTEWRIEEGVLLREDEHAVWLRTPHGSTAIARKAVLRRDPVEFRESRLMSPKQRLERRARKIEWGDADGWLRLAGFALFLAGVKEAEAYVRRARAAGIHVAANEAWESLKELGEPINDTRFQQDAEMQRERFKAVRRLGRLPHPFALPVLLKLIEIEPTPVGKLAAVLALRDMGRRGAVPGLIALLPRLSGDNREAALDALADLTGIRLRNGAAWEDWWARQGEMYLSGKIPVRPPPKHPSGNTRLFYGLPVDADRMVFVIDVSGSMAAMASYSELKLILTELPEAIEKFVRRIDVARWQLERVLRRLPENARFAVIAYNTEVRAFRNGLAGATKKNLEEATRFVDSVEPAGGTDILKALLEALSAFAGSGPGSVYLLSDGLPTAGETDPDRIVSAVKRLSRRRRIRIHAALISPMDRASYEAGSALLQRLTRQTGGRFVAFGVPPE